MDELIKTLKDAVEKYTYVDVSRSAAELLGVSPTKLQEALHILVRDHHNVVFYIKLKQLGSKVATTTKVLTPPDTTYLQVYTNREKIRSAKEI